MLKIILLIVPVVVGLLVLATWSIISAGGIQMSLSHSLSTILLDDMRPPKKDSFLFGNDIKNV